VTKPPREPLIDALRALALLGVVVVNAISYPFIPYGSPLGAPVPADSAAAIGAFALVAWVLQGKAYPLLAFLFGYSAVRAMGPHRGAAQLQQRRARMGRLLVIGVLHGALVYAGDILTAYAVAGWLLLRWARLPLRQLLGRGKLMATLALATVVLNTAVSMTTLSDPAGVPVPTFTTVDGVAAFMKLNASAYGYAVAAAFVYLPELLALMVGGAIVARLQGLTHVRWHRARERLVRWLLPLGAALSLIYAIGMTWAVLHAPAWQWVGLSIGPLAGWTLSAAGCVALAQCWHARRPAWLQACVPLGRYTLTLYVANSALCLLLFSGAAWKLPTGTVALLAYALALWFMARRLAAAAMRRGVRGPFEWWLSGSRT
jgi:uncharacterized protein